MTTPFAPRVARRGGMAEMEDDGALPDDEAGLVARVRGGSRPAAERLAAASYPMLFAACCRMTGNPDAAADLVQETYRKAWQALGDFRGASRFSTWLFRIAFTTHLKQLRRPRRIVPLEPVQEALAVDPTPSPEHDAAARERSDQLRRAVAGLPEELRFAVVAHYWADVPVREIALEAGITPVGVRKRLARAFRQIAGALEETPR
jgi:RNA polymerase sigma-70 factor (ECF subfamily)